jgi:hypothetical protein
MPIGIAFAIDQVPHRGGALAVFRITLGKTEIPGRRVCDRRGFVELAEWRIARSAHEKVRHHDI